MDIETQRIVTGMPVDTNDWDRKYDIESMRMSRFIAQDVEAAAESLGYEFSGIDAPHDPDGLYALLYAEFVVPLVQAVQELSEENALFT
jgi:hypothetical protein